MRNHFPYLSIDDFEPPDEWGYKHPDICFYPIQYEQITPAMKIVKDSVPYDIWYLLCETSGFYIDPDQR